METFIRLTIEQENLTVINKNNYEEKLVAISFSSHPASTSVDTTANGIKFSNEFLLHLFSVCSSPLVNFPDGHHSHVTN